MRDFFRRKTSEDVSEDHLVQGDNSLVELRRLLVGPLQKQFDEMQELMRDQGLHPDEISKILPEAIMLRSARDKQMVRAIEPLTEEAIKSSIEKDPRNLVEVLVPVMLPAIKRAITTLIKEMIQSFSATLEHGLSMRGLKWRYEAFKSKKPFGEVALLHSLVYQVEQIFLIHKESGLVLQHVVSDEAVAQDPDMVSAMLTAIQDFVRDSFGTGAKDENLENLQFGDRSVWIEQSSQAVLAGIVWGTAPEDLRSLLRDTLNAIHFEQLDNLRGFNGDTEPFERTEGRLSECLKNQFKPKRQNPLFLWTILTLVAIGIGCGAFFLVRDHLRWKDYLERLHEAPGIVITEAERRSGAYHVFGLRDTLAKDPEAMLSASKIDPAKVRFNWELYHSSHPEFIIRRITSILRPPSTVSFEIRDNILYGKGSASHHWIEEAKKLAEAIPGVLGLRTDDIIDSDLKGIEVIAEKIGKTLFFFDTVSTTVKPEQAHLLSELSSDIRELDRITQIFDKTFHIEIVGHTDAKGSDQRNLEISQRRANELSDRLIAAGVREEILITTGVGANAPLREELSEADREFNRCVNFRVTVSGEDDRTDVLPDLPPEAVEADEGETESLSEERKADSATLGPL